MIDRLSIKNFRQLDLNLLRVFVALLTEGTTVAAASKLNMSQPAVSAALGRLRAALDDQLLVREGNTLVPTDFALRVGPELAVALDRLEDMLTVQPEFSPEVATGRFRVAGSDFFGELFWPELTQRIAREAPGLRLHLVALKPDDYVGTLSRGEVSIALLPSAEPPRWAEQRHLFRARFVVIARKGHPVAGSLPALSAMPLDMYCALSHVYFSVEGSATVMGDAALEKIGRTRKAVASASTFRAVAQCVATSDSIAIVPEQYAVAVAPSLELSIFHVPVDLPLPVAKIAMVWHRRSSDDITHQWLRDQMTEILTEYDDPGSGRCLPWN